MSDLFEAGNVITAIREYRETQPDIVFLDINMGDDDGVTAIKEIIKIDPKAKIIMCTASGKESDVRKCVAEGATGYIVKPPLSGKNKRGC